MIDGYKKSLDGVRAIAILLVLAFHAGIIHFGWMGVQLFFVLSGYLITDILWREKFSLNPLSFKFKRFWARRVLRIFPLYFAYILLFGITYALFHFPEYYFTCLPYLLTYTYNYSALNFTPLFNQLWSLSVEEQFYLFFPLIIFLCPPRFIKFLMVTIILASPVIRLLLGEYYLTRGLAPETVSNTVYWNTLSQLDAFFIGGLIPVLSLHTRIKKPHRILLVSFILVIVAGLLNFLTTNSGAYYFNSFGYNHGMIQNYQHIWHYTLLDVLFGSFILTLVSIHSKSHFRSLRKLLESKIMVRIGKVSYGMYMFHFGILVYLYEPFIKAETIYGKILVFFPYLALVYLVAEISFRMYEIRFINLKDRLFVKTRTPAKTDNDIIASKDLEGIPSHTMLK